MQLEVIMCFEFYLSLLAGGSDYNPTMFPTSLVESGTDTVCQNITLEDDDIHEDLETFVVALTSNGPSVILQNSEGTVTIEDNEGIIVALFMDVCIQVYHVHHLLCRRIAYNGSHCDC